MAILLASTLCALALGELCLRLIYPGNVFLRGATRATWNLDNPAERVFVSHSTLGFLPILDGKDYDSHGARRNDYAFEKPANKQRLLFIGDSVTSRGLIVSALEGIAGDASYEYWNAGVEGYNTAQEVEYFKQWNAPLAPDHVILTFHNNDFEITPVTFVDSDNRLVVFMPRVVMPNYNSKLFGMSYLYRLLIAKLSESNAELNRVTITHDALVELKQLVQDQGAQLSVVLFPVMQSPDLWSDRMKKSRERSLRILEELDLRSFDLMQPLQTMLTQDISLQQVAGDIWHPSPAASAGFAHWLIAEGLLESEVASEDSDG